MAVRTLRSLRILLIGCSLALALACGGDGGDEAGPTATPGTVATPLSTGEPTRPYAAFADELAAALEREDAAWFAQRLGNGEASIQVRRWREEGLTANLEDVAAFMEAAFRSVDEEAEDEYGAGPLRLYAVGEQPLFGELRVVHLLVTGILEAPQPGRWAFVFSTGGSPEIVELTGVVELPPDQAREVLAFRPLPQPQPEPATYPPGLPSLVDDVRSAVASSDSAAIAARLKTSPLTCDEQTALYAPSCRSQPAGTVVDTVHWGGRCVQCSPGEGFATRDEVKAWLDRFFASTQTSAADDLGPAALQVESVFLEQEGYSINVTGVGDPVITDLPRPPGRWVFTLQTLAEGDDWRIVELQVADPDNSRWVLETWRGTGIAWTRWPPSD